MSRVYFRGTRSDVVLLAAQLQAMLSGKAPDTSGLGEAVKMAIGQAALSSIYDDYRRKMRGGTGEDGTSWQPLSQKYLAYGRRFGSGEKAALKRAAGVNGRTQRHGIGQNKGLLTAVQKKEWQVIFARNLAKFRTKMSEGEAKAEAAKRAWAEMKRKGAATMLEVYGHRQVDILKDTGILINSLAAGELTLGDSPTYRKPEAEGGAEQIFETTANSVIVGTNVKYAATHQYGDSTRNIPARPFLPDPERIPQRWWDNWIRKGNEALAIVARKLIEQEAARR